MKIKIETTYIPLILAYDDLPDGVELIRQPVNERRDINYTPVAVGILSFASGVSASLVASWIYEKIKKIYPDFSPAEHNLSVLRKRGPKVHNVESFNT